jgi:hypothetical protein
MKLNRIMLGVTAAVLVVGSTALVGYNRDADQSVVAEQTAVEQQGDSLDSDGTTQNASTSTDVGVESYAHGGGSHGGGAHGAAHGGGFHGAGHGGYGRGGYGHGYGYNHGGWAGGGRWGRWGGGRYVGGRYVGGPYYGWCNDSYYSCNRAW